MNCWSQRFAFSSDQIPFAVSLDQVNDIVAGDMRFIQNRAIAFTITLHDPSEYLSNADITFNWDFGDESGALISRELTVTHTYITCGSFKPQVVIQAVIPDKACDPPVDPPTKAPGPPADQGTTGRDGCCSTWETFRFPFMWLFTELVATKLHKTATTNSKIFMPSCKFDSNSNTWSCGVAVPTCLLACQHVAAVWTLFHLWH